MHKLFSFLFHWFLFAGTMFFADGASAIASVDGGGDGGAGGSSGDAGGATDDSSSAAAGEDSDQSLDGTSGDDSAQGDGAEDANAQVALADGRKIPAKYKELFEKDKDLRSIYFANQALKKTFPGGVKEAIGLARQIEEFGGVEGIERLQSELGVYSQDAEAFNNGDPKWIESSFTQDPDLSLKHFTNAFNYISEHHPEHYNHMMAKVIVNDMTNLPVEKIYDTLAGLKDNPQAQQLAKALAKYYNSRQEYAKNVPEKQIDPQQRKLDEQKAQLTEREQKVRNSSINAEAGPYLNRTIESSLSSAAKEAGFDLAKLQKSQPNRYGRFLKDVRNAVHHEILNDAKWLDLYSAALGAGDTAKCVRMLNKRHDQAIQGTEHKPGVAGEIFGEWFGTGKARPKPNTEKDAGGGDQRRPTFGKETPTLVNALPPAKDINYSDPLTDKWNGIYRLKTGKLIQVKRP